jgi:succinate dehydrogenase / fumarate reductase cytochrome b subunit
MAVAVTKENFFWHKLHSLTGIIPVGFYLLQHLTLNTFSLAGPDKYNGVSGFFYSMPEHVLLGVEVLLIWLPLLFHAVYGMFITSRAQPNYFSTRYKWSQNRMYTLQRYSGIFIFFFLIYHVTFTTINAKMNGVGVVSYYAMQETLSKNGYLFLIIYALGVLTASYHLCYGIWNFCIRWGITISDRAQLRVQKFAFGMFLVVTLIGWAALLGFLRTPDAQSGVSAYHLSTELLRTG